MSDAMIIPAKLTLGKKASIVALSLALVFTASCASKPKNVPATGASAARTSEAAPTNRPSPVAPAPSATASSALPPIARAEAFSDGAQAGLRPQAPAGAASASVLQAAASLSAAGDRIFFPTDRADLTDEARTILARQAAWINANPSKRVIVAGSADERGTREYNLALGSRRASAARDYLISLGVNASAIETVSYGKERPIDARSNAEGWAVNRNAQTQLLD